jgi:hypothetical protein
MNKKHFILAVVLTLTIVLFSCNSEKKDTQVLVIGTIHAGHNDNPNYSYYDLVNILGTYNPDVICVEIPPSYFRKQSYLKEMMIASIYGFDNAKTVYPIDWWPETNVRAERVKYMQTDDYKIKAKTVDSLVNVNTIMQNFVKKYGDLDSIWDVNKMGYEFFNGKEYNDYIRETYNIVINVYGDGCMNLLSEQRNTEMLNMIDSAITEHYGKRVIVFTGAEHKYYFDDALSKRSDLKLLELKEILPLKETAFTKNIAEFVEKNLPKGYFDTEDSTSIDLMYQGALVSPIHGMGMDDDPSIIPPENLVKIQPIIAEWEELNPHSAVLQFEKAWIKFLEKDYRKAIEISESISGRLDEFPKESIWFCKSFYWRNLGFCYDMTGQRERAVEAYKQCKKVCYEMGFNENYIKSIIKDFEREPYKRVK